MRKANIYFGLTSAELNRIWICVKDVILVFKQTIKAP